MFETCITELMVVYKVELGRRFVFKPRVVIRMQANDRPVAFLKMVIDIILEFVITAL